MQTLMANEKRLRMSFDAESEVIRRAVYIAAAMQGKTHNEVLNDLIKASLAEYIELAERAVAEDDPPPKKGKK